MLLLGQLYIDDDTYDDDSDTQQTNHDYIGSLVCMPNDPKRWGLTPKNGI